MTIRHTIILLYITVASSTATAAANENFNTRPVPKDKNSLGIADTSHVFDLDEVVVVAQPKETARLRRQPLSSTILTGQDLARSGGLRSLNTLSAYVPSFAMPAYGSRLTSAAYVRGIGSRVNNPAVGIYLDGIPLANKTSYNMHLYQISRVDILRGPQGTLYGMNTEGGLVRLYSKNPMTYQGTDISLGTSTHMGRNTEAAHYHKANDRLAFSVAGFYNGQDGFFRNATTGRRADKADEAGSRVRIVYKSGGKFTADMTADYQYTLQDAFAYGRLDTGNGHIADPAGNRPNTYKRNMLNTGLSLTYNHGAATVTSQTSYQYLNDRMDMDQDYLPQDYMHLCQRQLMNAVTQELTVKSQTGGAWWHTSGLYASYQWLKTSAPVYFDEDFTDRISSAIQSSMYSAILQAMTDRMTAAGMPPQAAQAAAAAAIEKAGGVNTEVGMQVPAAFRTPQANIGVYHESSLRLTPRLTATLGLRYDYNHTSINYDTRAAMAVTVDVMGTKAANTLNSALNNSTHDGFSQLLPKIGLSLDLGHDGSNAYAVVSKGYRAGGYNIQMFSDILQAELTANSQSAMGGDYDIPHTAEDYDRINRTIAYKPEESWNYELGCHLNLFGGTVHADLAAYCMQIRNQQLSVMAGTYGFGRMMVNAGRSRSLGVEAALRGSAMDNRLNWAATYSLTDARFTEYTETTADGATVNYEDKRVPYVPAHQLSARADFTFPLGRKAERSLTIGADIAAQGQTYWDEANTARQPLYALLNLDAALNWGKATLRLWCRNATNTHYATFAFSSSASGSELWFAQRGNPVQTGVELYLKL